MESTDLSSSSDGKTNLPYKLLLACPAGLSRSQGTIRHKSPAGLTLLEITPFFMLMLAISEDYPMKGVSNNGIRVKSRFARRFYGALKDKLTSKRARARRVELEERITYGEVKIESSPQVQKEWKRFQFSKELCSIKMYEFECKGIQVKQIVALAKPPIVEEATRQAFFIGSIIGGSKKKKEASNIGFQKKAFKKTFERGEHS
eukprot:Gb_29195 [translate_table: standard]